MTKAEVDAFYRRQGNIVGFSRPGLISRVVTPSAEQGERPRVGDPIEIPREDIVED
jgi:hypothetical protein